MKMEKNCRACGNPTLQIQGFGTEKLEDELSVLFPRAKTARLDLDSAKTKQGFEKIIRDFEMNRVQILVGTQMVTKGLDFENVSLVGIMNADRLFMHDDFRTAERSFQLMSQVAGRAGRNNQPSQVLIQTSQPQLPMFRYVMEHDYEMFYKEEIRQREKFYYPPFSRLIRLTFRHTESKTAWEAATRFSESLQPVLGKNVLGPAEPYMNKVRGQFIVQLLLKTGRSSTQIEQVKQKVQELIYELQNSSKLRSVRVIADVDPQ
jgi:primosomal protein N' (replication factor Y)